MCRHLHQNHHTVTYITIIRNLAITIAASITLKTWNAGRVHGSNSSRYISSGLSFTHSLWNMLVITKLSVKFTFLPERLCWIWHPVPQLFNLNSNDMCKFAMRYAEQENSTIFLMRCSSYSSLYRSFLILVTSLKIPISSTVIEVAFQKATHQNRLFVHYDRNKWRTGARLTSTLALDFWRAYSLVSDEIK